MQRQNTVTMSAEEFDAIHTKIWLITNMINNVDEWKSMDGLIGRIKDKAVEALNIMDEED